MDSGDDSAAIAAEDFARYIYSSGNPKNMTANSRGSGVLIFLVLDVQLIYIARSSALNTVLTEQRISRLITQILPLLNREKYETAIAEAIDGMAFYIKYGEPRFWERVGNNRASSAGLIVLLVFSFYASYVLCTSRVKEKRSSKIISHREQLDRVHGEMLKNRLSADTCPICLESFNEKSGTGTDGLPLDYIRCGHSYCSSCWWSWKEKVANECETLRCLICRQRVKSSGWKVLDEKGGEAENGFLWFY